MLKNPPHRRDQEAADSMYIPLVDFQEPIDNAVDAPHVPVSRRALRSVSLRVVAAGLAIAAVVAAICVAYFAGERNGESQAVTDEGHAKLLHSRMVGAVSPSGGLVVSGSVLSEYNTSYNALNWTALVQETFGNESLHLHDVSVENLELDGDKVKLLAFSRWFSNPVVITGSFRFVGGSLTAHLEAYPFDHLNTTELFGSALQDADLGASSLILSSNSTDAYILKDLVRAPRATAPLERGLNLVSSIQVTSIPEVAQLVHGSQPQASRRLLSEDAEMVLPLAGLVKPTLSVGTLSPLPGPYPVNKYLTLYNVSLSMHATEPHITVGAIVQLTIASQPAVNFTAEGTAGNGTLGLVASMPEWELQIEHWKVLPIYEPTINITGTKISGDDWTSVSTLSGTLYLGHIAETFTIPLASQSDLLVSITLGGPSGIPLSRDITLYDTVLMISKTTPFVQLKSNMTITTGQAQPLVLQIDGFFQPNTASLMGSVHEWSTTIGDTAITIVDAFVNVTVSTDAHHPAVSGSVTGEGTLGQYHLAATMALPANPLTGAVISLHATAQPLNTMADLLSATAAPAVSTVAAAPSELAAAVSTPTLESASLLLRAHPAALTLTGTLRCGAAALPCPKANGAASYRLAVVVQGNPSGKGLVWAAALEFTDPISLASLESPPALPQADTPDLVDGYLLLSSAAGVAVPLAPGSFFGGSVSANAPGLSLAAHVPVKSYTLGLASTSRSSLEVRGEFDQTTKAVVLSASIGPNALIASGVVANLTGVFNTKPSVSVELQGTVSVLSKPTVVVLTCSGRITANPSATTTASFSLAGSAANWTLSSAVIVDQVALQLSGQRTVSPATNSSGPSAAWSVSGDLTGTLGVGAASFAVEVPIPLPPNFAGAWLHGSLPDVTVCKGVTLTHITVDITPGSSTTDPLALAAIANISTPFAVSPFLPVSVSGTVSPTGTVTLAGSFSGVWVVSPALTVNDVAVSLSGVRDDAATGAMSLQGHLSGTITVLGGGTIALDANLPLVDGGITVNAADLVLGPDVTLTQAALDLQAVDPKVSLSATATVKTGVEGHALTAAVSGELLTKDSAKLTGSVDSWVISSDVEINDVAVDLLLAKTDAGLTYNGTLTGNATIAGINLLVNVNLPLSDLQATASFPPIHITKELQLTQGVISVDDSTGTPVFSIAGTANLTLSGGAAEPLLVPVTATATDGCMSFKSSVASWQWHVGHEGLTVTDALLAVAVASRPDCVFDSSFPALASNRSVAVTVTGAVKLGPWEAAASLNLTEASAEEAVAMELHLAHGGPTVTAAALAAAVADAAPVPQVGSALQGLTTAPLEEVTVFITNVPTLAINVSARVDFAGRVGAAARVWVQRQTDSGASSAEWAWAVGADVAGDFKVSDVVPGQTGLDNVPLSDGFALVASGPTYFPHTWGPPALTPGGTSIPYAGAVVGASTPLKGLSAELDASPVWVTSETNLVVLGAFKEATDGITLNATLPQNMPIGAHSEVIVNATALLSTSAPHFALVAAASISVGPKLAPIVADCNITIGDHGAFSLSGSAAHYLLKVGHKGVDSYDVALSLDFAPSTGVRGNLTATVVISGATLTLRVELPSASGDGVDVSLTAVKGTLSVNEITSVLCGPNPLALPPTFLEVLTTPVVSASISIDTDPVVVKVQGLMSIFHMKDMLAMELLVSESGLTDWGFGLGVAFETPFNMSQVLPSLPTAGILPAPSFDSGVLAVSSMNYTFATAADHITVNNGIALAVALPLTGHLAPLAKWSRVDALRLEADLGFASHQLKLTADVRSDWHIGSDVEVTQAGLFLEFGGKNGFEMGVECSLAVTLHSQTLMFDGTIAIGLTDLSFGAQMATPWVAPFGVHGLTINRTDVLLGISYAGVPDKLGLSGGLDIGNVDGAATVYLQASDPADSVLAASISELSLPDMVERLTHNAIPPSLANTLFGVSFTGLSLSVNLSPHALVFNSYSFPSGIFFDCAAFVLGPFHGSADVALSPYTGVLVNATVQPVSLAGGAVVLSGATGPASPAQLLIDVGASLTTDKIVVSASASILKLFSGETYLSISDNGWAFNVTYDMTLVSATIQMFSKGSVFNPSDFYLHAALEQELLSYISSHLAASITSVKTAVDAKLAEAKADLAKWEATKGVTLADNRAMIASLKAADTAKLSTAAADLRDASGAVANAKAKVNSLVAAIEAKNGEMEHCAWDHPFNCAHDVKVKAEIAALWVAKHAADLALSVASWGLSEASKAVTAAEAIVGVDPTIVKLEADDGALEAEEAAANFAVEAAQKVADGALDLMHWSAVAIGDTFNVEELSISAGSLVALGKSAYVDASCTAVILGKTHSLNFTVAFPPKEADLIENLWAEVKKVLHV